MNNTIYAVTFDRNYNDASIKQHGGVFVHIGQTSRCTEERLKDTDYNRKQGGGSPIILGEWKTQAKDQQIHKMLKRHPKVIQTQKEEFKFMVDNVETAESQIKQIVSDMIDQSIREPEEKSKRIKKMIQVVKKMIDLDSPNASMLTIVSALEIMLLQKCSLSGFQTRVYMVLCSFASNKETDGSDIVCSATYDCFPSLKTIAETLGMTCKSATQQVIRALKVLEDAGLIIRNSRGSKSRFDMIARRAVLTSIEEFYE